MHNTLSYICYSGYMPAWFIWMHSTCADEEPKHHQGVVLFLNGQLQVEQVAGLNLGGATVGTLQVCFQRNLVEILDFQRLTKEQELSLMRQGNRSDEGLLRTNQTFVVHLLEDDIQDEEEDLIGVVLCVTCENTTCVRCWSCELSLFFFLTSNSVPLQAVEKVSVGGQDRTVTSHSGKNPPQVQGDVLVLLPHTGRFPPSTI